jgi:HK97 family phage major capsid protein
MDYEVKAEEGFEGAIEAAQVEALREEIGALKAEIGEMRVKAARPALGAPGERGGEAKVFADQYLRKGLEGAPEVKSLSAGTPGDGGYAVPAEIDGRIETVLKDISPIRSVANVVRVGSADYRKLIATGGFASGWVSEIAARPETASPDFVEIAPPMGELYANPAASQAMLDDAMFDVEGWLAHEIGREFARAEGEAFVGGTGLDQPKGFLAYPTSAAGDAVRAFGTLQHVATGVSGEFAGVDPEDALIDLVHALRPAYRQGASFVMNSGTLARIRKMRDADGNFIWRPGLGEGQPASLLGYPVVEAEAMPGIGPDSLSVAFGNFKAGYVIAERTATRILRDPYSNKPFVHFYATRRVGGAVANSEAIKLLKFSAA